MIKTLLFLLLLSTTLNTFAHPLDISKSILGIKENKANITTYFHSFEIDYLLKINGLDVQSVEDYYIYIYIYI